MSRDRPRRHWSEPSSGSAPTATPEGRPRILAPTSLEAWAARRELRGTPIERTGVGLRQLPTGQIGVELNRSPSPKEDPVILLCGLAGSLVSDLPPGSVIIPQIIGLPDGRRFPCHPGWIEALAAAADRLGLTVDTGPLLTAPTVITGADRERWAAQGYRAADMEAGLLLAQGRQVATVRVILDSPDRSISDKWERPFQAFFQPDLWGELLWMVRNAPRYARLAARIVKQALA